MDKQQETNKEVVTNYVGTKHVEQIPPEHYESYMGDGVYGYEFD